MSEPQEAKEKGVVHKRPRKADHRQRAHCNPLSDAYIGYPESVEFVNWSLHFPKFFPCDSKQNVLAINTSDTPIDYSTRQPKTVNGSNGPHVEVLDMGCGYGGLLFTLGKAYPTQLMLGMEIRDSVTSFVGQKILALREENKAENLYQNVGVVRTNGMKFLSNYIRKSSLEKLFFCFPDPQFKRAKWRRRIISPPLLSTYAYHLKPNGLLYFVSDVPELFEWMRQSADMHPLFERIEDPQVLENDLAFNAMQNCTDEGKKKIREGCTIQAAMYRCVKPCESILDHLLTNH
eukprot:Gregarina_sp_Pseudo_9__1556@NODE_2043_length_1182_cov_12_678915_g1887_i0_p1_GENE_NODE_2043_length_1182_cov_12_678915_g1887_i0NODE_2043_length_1182_cov_12_678915_g1887_i0_p1_ORF_typecomplete_len290_score18_50Methyltransf_4/PF02390_17/1_4e52Methyltransf_31/PF13847_6/8_8e05MTS/PF05175_14/0_00015Methyltransf_23/PF13489_6/0_032Methyltransf_25/PF13649_6/0_028MetW/PF07021_12/0_04DOT1/PF08123_13/0_039CMAS/PF02353_20/0_043Pox_MCEL/PF03291_16/0_14Methyltransf_12/PF08242_12/0_2Methyltransf_12/PF08242_12/6_